MGSKIIQLKKKRGCKSDKKLEYVWVGKSLVKCICHELGLLQYLVGEQKGQGGTDRK